MKLGATSLRAHHYLKTNFFSMGNLTVQENFQERMFNRVRESLAELLTEEEAKTLVERAISEGLFKPRQEKDSSNWNAKTRELPSEFATLVTDQVKPIVEQQIKQWLSDNSDQVLSIIQGVVERGIANVVLQVIKDETSRPMWNLKAELQQRLLNH